MRNKSLFLSKGKNGMNCHSSWNQTKGNWGREIMITRKRLLGICFGLTLALSLPTVSPAQDRRREENANMRSVQGTVTDTENNLIDGAVVQLKDTKSLQVRSFITKKEGTYHFNGLNPNVDYELRADYQNFSSDTKTLSSFDSRKVANINLSIKSKR